MADADEALEPPVVAARVAGEARVVQAAPAEVPANVFVQILTVLQAMSASLATVAASQTQVRFLQASNWTGALLQDLATASRVRVSCMLYDHLEMHQAILRRFGRLRVKGPPLDVQVVVDRVHHERRTSPQQQPRLLELLGKGVPVRLGHGELDEGVLHQKLIVLDEHIAYVGSANFTGASMVNREGLVRLVGGPIIHEVLNAIVTSAADATPLEPLR